MTKLLLVLVALSACASANAAELPRYQALDLRTLGGRDSLGTAINEAGQVTGFSNTANGETHAFLYSDGRMIDLGTFGGSFSVGWDINEAGQVTGFASESSDNRFPAFLYTNGTMVNLGTLPGGDQSQGTAINESGQIAGFSWTAANLHAFLYENGEMFDLGTLVGSQSQATGINDAGDVFGSFLSSTTDFGRPFVYRDGAMLDLGTLGGNFATAFDMNESGQVVGSSQTADNIFGHAFLHTDGMMHDLGTLGGLSSGAGALNNAGDVVGAADTLDGKSHAFLFSQGLMVDIVGAMLGEDNSFASDINNRGQITGGASSADARRHYAFVYSDGEVRNVNDLVVGLIPRPVRRNVGIVEAGAGPRILNDRGQILARAIFENAQRTLPKRTHAVLLTPISLLFEQLIARVIGADLNESLLNKVRESFSHYSAGRKPGTCSKLQTFILQVESLQVTSIPAARKRDLLARARAIRQAIGCS